MITYSKTISDTYRRIRDLAWMNGRFFAIAGICVLPASAYFIFAGTVSNSSAALKLGFQLLTLAAVLVAIYIIVYNKTKKAVQANFDEFEIDGKIDFSIEKIDDDTLEFTRLTDEESFQITKADVKCVKRLKYNNVIVLKDKRTIDLPKRADIDELIHF